MDRLLENKVAIGGGRARDRRPSHSRQQCRHRRAALEYGEQGIRVNAVGRDDLTPPI